MRTTLFAVISGVFIARGREDTIVTKNMVVGESVYGEKRISTEVCSIRVRALAYSILPPTTAINIIARSNAKRWFTTGFLQPLL